jgi:hypothetical protein
MSTNPIVVMPIKNTALAIVLGLIFGPLGLFYSSVIGGIVMLVVSVPLAIFTLGFSLIVTQPACAIWAAVAANNYNKKLLSGQAVGQVIG